MEPPQTFYIEARIDHSSDGVGCFDPVQVICRMRGAFPQLIQQSRDPLWETCNYFRTSKDEGAEDALRIAIKDMLERGPKLQFEIPLEGGRVVKGTAERYCVLVTSAEEFPEDFRRAFKSFLEDLKFQSIQVSELS